MVMVLGSILGLLAIAGTGSIGLNVVSTGDLSVFVLEVFLSGDKILCLCIKKRKK